jgi:outer membrane protein OmpA-like peptidoglycan-associated protein
MSDKEQVMEKFCRKMMSMGVVLAMAVSHAGATQAAMETETKQDLAAISAIVTGAAVAGPIGVVAGAFAGVWLADTVEKADQLTDTTIELDATEAALIVARSELNTVRDSLVQTQRLQEQYARMALDQLQLEMLFRTNDAQLTQQGEERLSLLAAFLEKNADLDIRIEGFADPRGTAAQNLRLSQARANAVAELLSYAGVDESRMSVVALGESESTAQEGDTDAYAMERLVRIELLRAGSQREVAAVDLGMAD